ncbi:SusC/RagA family TonB-linked outer membrane protein [Aquimarina agarilytica]|uniref:SusC/RagA family TonB-linked outer membrane protein n=1 Tax=Aquimarina agarilytica TaxID=1087449 RepID=UPI000287E88A|nr:SusC/RagA family TonB-linked outer membrane protein [Aquimarina agarilytica]
MHKKTTKLFIGLFLLVIQITLAQNRTIAGSVTDESGLPLPGANVFIENKPGGTVTDFDGKFVIEVSDADTIVISYVGYVTQNILVGNQSAISVQLLEDTESLEEVVVTAFGIKRNPKEVGYAVTSIKAEKVTENSEPDLVRSIAGKVPGVNVNFSTGVAGAANQINIRGATSIIKSTQPLVIVDGVSYSNDEVTTSSSRIDGGPYESALSSLDPNNIASITVLKSVAASALYGSRAANGVIIITTKTGSDATSKKKLNISVSSGTYFENIANLPEYQNTYGNGVNFGYQNVNGSWGPRFDSLETIPVWNGISTAFPGLLPNRIPYEAQPDNVKDLFKTGVVLDNSINIGYSGEDGNFTMTLSDLDQDGYIPFNTYDRNSISVGGNFKLNKKLSFGGNMSYSDTQQVGPFLGNNQLGDGASSFARALWLGRVWDFNLPFTDANGGSVIPNTGYDHPLWSWQRNQIITDTDRTVANFNFSYRATDKLSFSYRLGLNKYELDRTQIRDIGSRADGGLGSIREQSFTNEDIESTFLATYNFNITEDLSLRAIAGHNLLQKSTDAEVFEGVELVVPGIYNIENTLSSGPVRDADNDGTNDFGSTRSRQIGVFGEIEFAYKDYAFINATGRNDWVSTLPKENSSFFYPSVNASLIFTSAFNLNSDVLTYGKIRGGYGLVGAAADAEFTSRVFNNGNAFNGVPVIGNQTNFSDVDLKAEFTSEFELGTDLEFFNRRIGIDFTWYKKVSEDVIAQIPIPISSGFENFNTNAATLENTGFEIGLDLTPFKTKDFSWNSITNFTKNVNEVTDIVEGVDVIPIQAGEIPHIIKGQPFGVFYGTKFARDNEGNFLIDRATGGIVADVDPAVVGDPNPDFRISFINTFKYKSFSLRSQFEWKEGGDISSVSINSLLGRGVTRDTENRERSVVIPGFYGDNNGNLILDAEDNKIPNTTQISTNELYFSPSGANTFGINTVDEGSIYDGTVYRLRELSLTYDMPRKYLSKLPFSRLSISAVGNNLWYFAPNVPKYTNFDPEVTSFGSGRLQGVEVSAAPTAKRYGFRINASF